MSDIAALQRAPNDSDFGGLEIAAAKPAWRPAWAHRRSRFWEMS